MECRKIDCWYHSPAFVIVYRKINKFIHKLIDFRNNSQRLNWRQLVPLFFYQCINTIRLLVKLGPIVKTMRHICSLWGLTVATYTRTYLSFSLSSQVAYVYSRVKHKFLSCNCDFNILIIYYERLKGSIYPLRSCLRTFRLEGGIAQNPALRCGISLALSAARYILGIPRMMRIQGTGGFIEVTSCQTSTLSTLKMLSWCDQLCGTATGPFYLLLFNLWKPFFSIKLLWSYAHQIVSK